MEIGHEGGDEPKPSSEGALEAEYLTTAPAGAGAAGSEVISDGPEAGLGRFLAASERVFWLGFARERGGIIVKGLSRRAGMSSQADRMTAVPGLPRDSSR